MKWGLTPATKQCLFVTVFKIEVQNKLQAIYLIEIIILLHIQGRVGGGIITIPCHAGPVVMNAQIKVTN